ncbi:MAG: hypothetical protein CL920_33030 [Deltaproteobacteria bacterium]|nr:hypothetical protein [Deltaproteobacteria bacterium]MBU53547.1 hypothetical protein [Deltaproteobacteria bacterium]
MLFCVMSCQARTQHRHPKHLLPETMFVFPGSRHTSPSVGQRVDSLPEYVRLRPQKVYNVRTRKIKICARVSFCHLGNTSKKYDEG